jgi:hypothetical protein
MSHLLSHLLAEMIANVSRSSFPTHIHLSIATHDGDERNLNDGESDQVIPQYIGITSAMSPERCLRPILCTEQSKCSFHLSYSLDSPTMSSVAAFIVTRQRMTPAYSPTPSPPAHQA